MPSVFGTNANAEKNAIRSEFAKQGTVIVSNNRDLTLSTRNKTQDVYWMNPPKRLLLTKWGILLHNPEAHAVYYFEIEPFFFVCDECKREVENYHGARKAVRVIPASKLNERRDKPDYLHIEIYCDDKDFIDKMSGYKFVTHYVDEIHY